MGRISSLVMELTCFVVTPAVQCGDVYGTKLHSPRLRSGRMSTVLPRYKLLLRETPESRRANASHWGFNVHPVQHVGWWPALALWRTARATFTKGKIRLSSVLEQLFTISATKDVYK